MELTAAVALGLLVISEIMPFTPFRSNGIVQQLLRTARQMFPYRPSR